MWLPGGTGCHHLHMASPHGDIVTGFLEHKTGSGGCSLLKSCDWKLAQHHSCHLLLDNSHKAQIQGKETSSPSPSMGKMSKNFEAIVKNSRIFKSVSFPLSSEYLAQSLAQKRLLIKWGNSFLVVFFFYDQWACFWTQYFWAYSVIVWALPTSQPVVPNRYLGTSHRKKPIYSSPLLDSRLTFL